MEAAIVVVVEEASVETTEAVGEAAGATLEDGEAVVSEVIEVEVEVEVVVDEAVVPASQSRSSRKLKAPRMKVAVFQSTDHAYSNPQPQDPKIAKVEDASHPVTKKLPDLGGLKLTQAWPIRPGYGTRGAKVELTANYVELLPPSTLVLYRYDIAIIPEVAGRKAFRLVQLLLQSAELAPYQGHLATDFRSTLISKTKLALEETVIEITYCGDGEDEPLPNAITYKVRVKYTRTLSMSGIINYLSSTNLSESFHDKQELTQALNIFLNHYAKSADNIAAIGSSKTFSLNQSPGRGDLGAGLEVIRGFFSSVRVATCRILVNINASYGAFYRAGPLPALMHSYGTRSTVALEKFLKLVRVETTHLREKRNKANKVIPRIKTIFGLARKDDGNRLAHPPRVSQPHGAGAKGVDFWLDGNASSSGAPKADAQSAAAGTGKGKGKSKGKAQPQSAAASGSGRYISVFDFFKISTSFSCLSRVIH
jgi:eukaryotic translation initiation factor 2C